MVRVDALPTALPLRNFSNDNLELTALYRTFNRVILTAGQPVDSLSGWSSSLLSAALIGAAGGGAGLGVAAGIAELTALGTGVAVGVGTSAVFSAGAAIPVFLTCALLALTAGAVGKNYARRYKQTLQKANEHLRKEEYQRAAAILDQEFNSWFVRRALRKPFLSKAHYAIAHLFRGMCAERMETVEKEGAGKDYKKAYTEYGKALADAKQTSGHVVTLLLHLQLIQLLRKHGSNILSPSQDPDALIRNHLNELNHHFKDSLTHLYWQVCHRMRSVTELCRSNQVLSPEVHLFIRDALNIDSLFALDGFEAGRGNYLETVYLFFQTVTTGYFQLQLLSPALDSLLYLLDELTKVFNKLNDIGVLYPHLVNEAPFQTCSHMMRHFALTCGVMALRKYGDEGILANLTRLLDVSAEELDQMISQQDQAITFLMRIQSDFGFSFQSITAWLNALNASTERYLESRSSTGNTMLHMLAQLPAEQADPVLVKTIAQQMKRLIYVRNDENHTPLVLLAERDPYGIKPEIVGEKVIPLGNMYQEVDGFMRRVKNNVDAEGHFLLLAGSPGTGKTEVLNQLRLKQHTAIEWRSGARDDRYVGQSVNRAIEFFAEGKRQSNRNAPTLILFIDEIDSVCPATEGTARNGYHNQSQDVTEFQKQISYLKGHNVALVGATNHPERLSKAIQNRMTRVTFPLPNRAERQTLLNHFFRCKCLSQDAINQMANLTDGWSQRQLLALAEAFEETLISQERLEQVFEDHSKLVQKDFRTEFPAAYLTLPRFRSQENAIALGDGRENILLPLQEAMRQPQVYEESGMHALLYGPPGGGKTTAMRAFARRNNCPFILIESLDTVANFQGVFERAKGYDSLVIICIDEIDPLTCTESPVREFLQKQMNGFLRNNILIVGTTNHPEWIDRAIMDRFAFKIAVPLPALEAVGLFIRAKLNAILQRHSFLSCDLALQGEMSAGCIGLARLGSNLSYRELAYSFSHLHAKLLNEKRTLLTKEEVMRYINAARPPMGAGEVVMHAPVVRRVEDAANRPASPQAMPAPVVRRGVGAASRFFPAQAVSAMQAGARQFLRLFR